MERNNDYILKLMREIAEQQSKQLQSSYVVRGAEFKPMLAKTNKLFVPLNIPKLTK